jgi:hypothetical protein
VGPRAGLDTEDRGEILCPCRGSNPDRPVVQPVVRHYNRMNYCVFFVETFSILMAVCSHNVVQPVFEIVVVGTASYKTIKLRCYRVVTYNETVLTA